MVSSIQASGEGGGDLLAELACASVTLPSTGRSSAQEVCSGDTDPFDDFDEDDFDDEFDDDFEEDWEDDLTEDEEFPDTFGGDDDDESDGGVGQSPFSDDPDFDDE